MDNAAFQPLLYLPQELRLCIWSYCLNVGVINPYDNLERRNDTESIIQSQHRFNERTSRLPQLHLLLTCELIYVEAVRILYHENAISLPSAASTARFFRTTLNSPERLDWLRSVHLSLGVTDMTNKDWNHLGKHLQMTYPGLGPNLRRKSEIKAEHVGVLREYLQYVIYPRKLSFLLCTTKLYSLRVEVLDLPFWWVGYKGYYVPKKDHVRMLAPYLANGTEQNQTLNRHLQ